MQIDKIQNLNEGELRVQESQTGEQLFRLRFQKSLGNNEGTKKLRELRKDIARIKTIARQRQLGITAAPVVSSTPAKRSRTKKEA